MYVLGVDVGTTRITASAVCVDGHHAEFGPTTPVAGSVDDMVSAATFVLDDGRIVAGDEAERLGLERPENLIRGYVNRVGDAVCIVVGDRSFRAETVMAAAVSELVDRAAARYGRQPLGVGVTHPAAWGSYKVALLDAALEQAGIQGVQLVADAAAAAAGHASDLPDAGTVAVFDLGGDSVSAAVVTCDEGSYRVVGSPQRVTRSGGADFDHALFEHVCRGVNLRGIDRSTPGLGAAVGRLRSSCTSAKEALSVDTDAMVPIGLPGIRTRVRVVRSEFEDLIRPAVRDSVGPLLEAIEGAGLESADIDAVLLVGGSSRIPLVVQSVSAELRRPIVIDETPDAAVAVGAARMTAARARAADRHQDQVESRHGGSPLAADDPAGTPVTAEPVAVAGDAGAAAGDVESPDAELVAGWRRTARGSTRRRRSAPPSAPTAAPGGRVRRAVATTMLATAIFSTSSIAAPHILESGGTRDDGVTARSTAKPAAFRGSNAAWSSSGGSADGTTNSAGAAANAGAVDQAAGNGPGQAP